LVAEMMPKMAAMLSHCGHLKVNMCKDTFQLMKARINTGFSMLFHQRQKETLHITWCAVEGNKMN
jgi:hypothetical protein